MRTRSVFSKTLILLLGLALAVPGPALALREPQEDRARQELEERLVTTSSARVRSGLEEKLYRVLTLSGHPNEVIPALRSYLRNRNRIPENMSVLLRIVPKDPEALRAWEALGFKSSLDQPGAIEHLFHQSSWPPTNVPSSNGRQQHLKFQLTVPLSVSAFNDGVPPCKTDLLFVMPANPKAREINERASSRAFTGRLADLHNGRAVNRETFNAQLKSFLRNGNFEIGGMPLILKRRVAVRNFVAGNALPDRFISEAEAGEMERSRRKQKEEQDIQHLLAVLTPEFENVQRQLRQEFKALGAPPALEVPRDLQGLFSKMAQISQFISQVIEGLSADKTIREAFSPGKPVQKIQEDIQGDLADIEGKIRERIEDLRGLHGFLSELKSGEEILKFRRELPVKMGFEPWEGSPRPGLIRPLSDEAVRDSLDKIPASVFIYLGMGWMRVVPAKAPIGPGSLGLFTGARPFEPQLFDGREKRWEGSQRIVGLLGISDIPVVPGQPPGPPAQILLRYQTELPELFSQFGGEPLAWPPPILQDQARLILRTQVIRFVGQTLFGLLPGEKQRQWSGLIQRGGSLYELSEREAGFISAAHIQDVPHNFKPHTPEQVKFGYLFALLLDTDSPFRVPTLSWTPQEERFVRAILAWVEEEARPLEPLAGTYLPSSSVSVSTSSAEAPPAGLEEGTVEQGARYRLEVGDEMLLRYP